jgi:hypothetical protein
MPLFKQALLSRIQNQQSGEAGDAGGGTAPLKITPEIQALIDAQVSGLKAKNSELIAGQKALKEQLSGFEGIDPQVVHTILKRFSDDEEAGLIKAGKIDEVLTKRTERMTADHARQIKAREELTAKAEAKAQKLAARTLQAAIRDAAIKAGALPEALDDIVLRGNAVWSLNEDGEPVALSGSEITFGKDGKTPLTPTEWAQSLRDTATHLWPRAQGTNAPGARGGASGGKTMTRAQFMAIDQLERANVIKGGTTVVD